MTEKVNPKHETGFEKKDYGDSHENRLKKHHEAGASRARHEHRESIDHILETIEREAKSSSDIDIEKATNINSAAVPKSGQGLTEEVMKQNLQKIRRNLSTSERAFSRLIHNPALEIASDITSKTLARPSGLLFGGSFALISNLATLTICRHLGYEYNYLIGIVGFLGGFIFGLIAELLYRKVLRRRL